MSSESPQEDKPATVSQPSSKPTKYRVWLRRGLEVFLFIILIMGVRAWQQRDVVKGIAPPLIGVMLDDKAYILASKPKHPVLVHFWATWCPICRAEQGSIESIAHDNPNVITIAMQSGSSDIVQQYMHDQGINFPVINDEAGHISASWGVQAVPASFIVDSKGEIRNVEIGYTTEIGLRIRLWLAGL